MKLSQLETVREIAGRLANLQEHLDDVALKDTTRWWPIYEEGERFVIACHVDRTRFMAFLSGEISAAVEALQGAGVEVDT